MKLGRFEEHEIFEEYDVSDSMDTPYRSPSYLKTKMGFIEYGIFNPLDTPYMSLN